MLRKRFLLEYTLSRDLEKLNKSIGDRKSQYLTDRLRHHCYRLPLLLRLYIFWVGID